MPPRSEFIGGKLKLPIVISWDATGFGNQQFNTAAVNNPFTPESAQQLRIFGLVGQNCADSCEGTVRLFGPNLDTLNEWIAADQADECASNAAAARATATARARRERWRRERRDLAGGISVTVSTCRAAAHMTMRCAKCPARQRTT
eukprot:4679309-Prymnesium_polylepis.1